MYQQQGMYFVDILSASHKYTFGEIIKEMEKPESWKGALSTGTPLKTLNWCGDMQEDTLVRSLMTQSTKASFLIY